MTTSKQEIDVRLAVYMERLDSYIESQTKLNEQLCSKLDRLDETIGAENWTNDFTQSPNGGVLCTLGVRVDDSCVYKKNEADNTEVERVKGGLSNAMKRAGVQWGIGRYLYKLPTTFADFNTSGRFKTRIDGDPYRWNPPRLTEEFLPPSVKTKTKINQGDK